MALVLKRKDGESMVYRVPAGEACEIRVQVDLVVDERTGKPTGNVLMRSDAPKRVEIVRGEIARGAGAGAGHAPVHLEPAGTPAPPPKKFV